jgi:tetratricopeptide (TPR) repeat protein
MVFVLAVLLSGSGLAQQADKNNASQPASSSPASLEGDSPAQRGIAAARQQLKADPNKLQAWNELANALIRRARETANPSYLVEADGALTEGMKRDSNDFQLLRTKVVLLLSKHEFVQARDLASILNRRIPDDVMTYGYLARADIALGNYPEAETNAQWMMNMRPNNTPALLVGAELRVLFGDAHGAIEFLNRAYSQSSPLEVEDQAWIANRIASIQIESGQDEEAAQTLARANELFPHYPYTMENLARVRMKQNRPSDAVQLLVEAASADHDPHVLFELAKAREAAGQLAEARATYADFERLVSLPGSETDTARIDLILMYAERNADAPKALALARQEIAKKQDVWTLDAYAWALYANQDYSEADESIQKAMSVGIQSAQIFDHAAHIALKLNHTADASKHFELALRSNPSSEFASDARKSMVIASEPAERGPTASTLRAPSETQSSLAANSGVQNRELTKPDPPTAGIETRRSTPVFAPIPALLLTPRPTGTDHLILSAQAAVARSPNDSTAYAALGAAYFQHARETGDISDYQFAEQSLGKSLDLTSSDFSSEAALETMAEVCMGEHRFSDALTYAQKALSLGTGELAPFAIVGDAYADMGEYDKAAVAYSRLTPRDATLSPRAAYARDSRLSYLKFISGDTAGAIDLMTIAVEEGVQAQIPSENLSWLYYELGEYNTQAGDVASADAAYLVALTIHPGDYRSLAAMGKLRANAGRFAEAIALYQAAIAVVPMPVFIAELGDLYVKTGNQAEAKKQFALVEYIGLLGHINRVLHNRDLAIFYADHDVKLTEALDLAQKELEVRKDVYTWDALAWALYKNGKLTEAAQASEKALQFGSRDSLLLFHAGMIAEGQGKRGQARSELKEALQINPHFHLIYASAAQQKLADLEAQTGSKGGSDSHAR